MTRQSNNKKKKRKLVSTAPAPTLARTPTRPRPPPAELSLLRGQAGDLFSMVLVRWTYARLVHFSRLCLAVLQYRAQPHQFDEALRGIEQLEVEAGAGRHCTLLRFYSDVLRNAMHETERCDAGARAYYTTLLRGCFLVALVHDARLYRFCLAQHTVLARHALPCQPLELWRVRGFLPEARRHVGDFLARQLSLPLATARCVECWREDFMLRTYNEATIDEDERADDVEVAILGGTGIHGDP